MNESFVFYRSFAEALNELPAEQYKEVMVALSSYALDGALPDTDCMSQIARMVFTLVKPQIDANTKRRENGSRGGRPSAKPLVSENAENKKPMVSKKASNEKPNANANVNANANDNANDNANEKSKRFAPPSVEEVAAYCRERRNRVNPQQFVDFYASKGWRVGNQPMKDWKAAMRTWEQRDKDLPRDNHGTEREQDLDAVLLNQIIGRRSNDNMGTMPTPGRAGYYTGELTAQYAGP